MAGLGNVYVAFLFIASGGLLYGYIIGINSNVITHGQLECKDEWDGEVGSWTSIGYRQCFKLNSLNEGLLSSLNIIGALLSSLVCFKYSDSLGRKLEVQIGALLYLLGSVIASASPTLWGIYVGLTIYGLGIGFAMHAAPVYIAEISPADVRGTMVSAKEAVIVLGIFLGFFVGFVFHSVDTIGWRFMVLIAAAVALIMEVGIAFVPESPRFLVLKAVRSGGLLGPDEGLLLKASTSLQYFRRAGCPEDVAVELESIRVDIAAAVSTQAARCTDPFRYPLPLAIGCGLVFLQQVTGQPSVLYFATNIFKGAGFGGAASLSSLGVGGVKLLATLFTVWRVDRYGRRLLLFIGITMMAIALVTLGVAFLFQECQVPGKTVRECSSDDTRLPRGWALATVVALMLYVSGYQVGFGPISWLIISEVFPVSVRGAALSLAAVVNFGSNIAVTLTKEVFQDAMTPAGVFFAYFALSIVSLIFNKVMVPETKGKTLEEIESMLAGRKPSARALTVGDPARGA